MEAKRESRHSKKNYDSDSESFSTDERPFSSFESDPDLGKHNVAEITQADSHFKNIFSYKKYLLDSSNTSESSRVKQRVASLVKWFNITTASS